MTSRSLLARACAVVLGLSALGCRGDDEVLPEPLTVHLFDRPARAVAGSSDALAALDARLAEDTVWVLNERVPEKAWSAVRADSGQALWRAPTRFRALHAREGSPEEMRRSVPGAPIEPGADVRPGRVRVSAAGVEVPLGDPDARPDLSSVSYVTSSAEVRAALATVDDAGRPEPRETDLAKVARRAVVQPVAGGGLEWTLELPPAARLHFAFALDRQALRVRRAGVQLVPPIAPCRFAVEVEAEGRVETAWELAERPVSSELDRWNDVTVDLAAFAGRTATVRLTASVAADGDEAPPVPTVAWAEPVVASAARQAAPDVVVILLDTLRADRLGCYGWERARTPNLDALARRGVRYDQAMSAAPWTLPSHASLFTSSYVSQHGLWTESRLADEQVTLAEALRARGYRTGAFTEGGFVRTAYGMAQGFDVFEAVKREGAETFASALDWIEDRSGPFFAFVQTYQTHSPYDPPDEQRSALVRPYDGPMKPAVHVPDYGWAHGTAGVPPPSAADVRYMSDLYDAEIAYADQLVGEFLAALEQRGLGDDLLVVVTSDHGDEFLEHGQAGHGWSLYEEQLRIPLILSLPGTFDGGQELRHPVHQVDIAPTIARVARAAVPPDWVGQPLGFATAPAERPLFAPYRTRFHKDTGLFGVALREGDLKYVDYPTGQRPLDPVQGPALFDLAADPGETRNILSPEGAARWRAHVDALLERYPDRGQARALEAGAMDEDELRALGYVGGEGDDETTGGG